MRSRPQTDAHYASLVADYLKRNGITTRSDIDNLLGPMLPDVLDSVQRKNKISNQLGKMRRDGTILNACSRTKLKWELS